MAKQARNSQTGGQYDGRAIQNRVLKGTIAVVTQPWALKIQLFILLSVCRPVERSTYGIAESALVEKFLVDARLVA
ncbi:MAG TPA: hypothetical protein DHV61_04000 [Glutamicibacter sp.]|nr:hypothetical protein [Glutamicibacter sp.]